MHIRQIGTDQPAVNILFFILDVIRIFTCLFSIIPQVDQVLLNLFLLIVYLDDLFLNMGNPVFHFTVSGIRLGHLSDNLIIYVNQTFYLMLKLLNGVDISIIYIVLFFQIMKDRKSTRLNSS